MKRIVFDTETTGLPKREQPLSAQPKIIELGAAIYENGELLAEYSQMIHPGEAIEEIITKITGIKNEDLVGMPSFREAWEGRPERSSEDGILLNPPVPSFKEFLQGCECLIAHNAEFDTKLLSFELQRMELDPKEFIPKEVLCTVAEFRHVFGRRAKLTELYEKMIGKPLDQTHRALDDVKALAEVCLKAGLLS